MPMTATCVLGLAVLLCAGMGSSYVTVTPSVKVGGEPPVHAISGHQHLARYLLLNLPVRVGCGIRCTRREFLLLAQSVRRWRSRETPAIRSESKHRRLGIFREPLLPQSASRCLPTNRPNLAGATKAFSLSDPTAGVESGLRTGLVNKPLADHAAQPARRSDRKV